MTKTRFDITMLKYNLHRVQMLDWYVTTFDVLIFVPLLGLKWDAVDFENAIITIRHTIVNC